MKVLAVDTTTVWVDVYPPEGMLRVGVATFQEKPASATFTGLVSLAGALSTPHHLTVDIRLGTSTVVLPGVAEEASLYRADKALPDIVFVDAAEESVKQTAEEAPSFTLALTAKADSLFVRSSQFDVEATRMGFIVSSVHRPSAWGSCGGRGRLRLPAPPARGVACGG